MPAGKAVVRTYSDPVEVSIPLAELWGPHVIPRRFEESLFMVIAGYMDESMDDEWFTLAAIFSTGICWTWIAIDWDRCIKRWDKRMVSSGRKPLRRYHGTDCAGSNEDFEGWKEAERDEFLNELRNILSSADGLHSVALSLRPSDVADVFGLTDGNAIKRSCYTVLLQYVMLQLGEDIESRNPGYEGTRVVLFHDHTKFYDATIHRAFYELKDDPGFRYQKYFQSVTAETWQDCIPLQPADMVAFETRRQTIRSNSGSPLGGEMKKLLELPSMGGIGFYFRRDNIETLKQLLDEVKYKLGTVPPTPKRKHIGPS